MPPVDGLELRITGANAVGALQRVVGVQAQREPGGRWCSGARSGQSRHALPKTALRVRVIGRVTPFGQVTEPS